VVIYVLRKIAFSLQMIYLYPINPKLEAIVAKPKRQTCLQNVKQVNDLRKVDLLWKQSFKQVGRGLGYNHILFYYLSL
jgi:hypothetical protein